MRTVTLKDEDMVHPGDLIVTKDNGTIVAMSAFLRKVADLREHFRRAGWKLLYVLGWRDGN